MNVARLLRKFANPAFAVDAARYLLNDAGSALRIYRSPLRNILVIGLPKSGSTWVQNMLLELPGYNPRYYQALHVRGEDGSVRPVRDNEGRFLNDLTYDNIDDAHFAGAPRRGLSVYKFHARASERNLAIIERQAPRWIVTYRDLRDVLVSRYFHFKSDPHNHYYPLYQQLGQEEALRHTAGIVRDEFVPWVRGWREAARRAPEKVCQVRYEDLWTDTRAELARIVQFLGVPADARYLERAAGTRLTEEQDLGANLASNDRLLRRNTARKGGVGGWKDYFDAALKAEFKAFAGEVLIDLGYEQGLDW